MTTPEQIEQAKQEIRERAHLIGMKFKESELLHVPDDGNDFVFLRKHIASKFDEGLGCYVEVDENLCYIELHNPDFKISSDNKVQFQVLPKLQVLQPGLFSKVEGNKQIFYDGEVVEHL